MEEDSDNKNKEAKAPNKALETTGKVVDTAGKASISFIGEIISFFLKLTFKAKLMFLFLSVVMITIAYFLGFQAGKENVKEELNQKYQDAIERLGDLRDDLDRDLF